MLNVKLCYYYVKVAYICVLGRRKPKISKKHLKSFENCQRQMTLTNYF